MRKIYFLAVVTALLSSCTPQVHLKSTGRLTLASTKNVGFDKKYEVLSRSAGFDESQVKGLENRSTKRKTKRNILENYEKLKSNNVEQAINNVIESVPGGIYMENVEIFVSTGGKVGSKDVSFVASGDVYGMPGKGKSIRGFYVGCKAFYQKATGTVVALVDDQYCLFQAKGKQEPEKLLYDDLIKVGK
ncbi:hypothetical protein [uncultured Microscilla sp.]|uniref:hypothetical protein n=1 Tax=uncultured Microscilla sp. TaxID=432653 RepID=UPI0026351A5D|nr:hypothetical protein [uncultured Microscilla sp.]